MDRKEVASGAMWPHQPGETRRLPHVVGGLLRASDSGKATKPFLERQGEDHVPTQCNFHRDDCLQDKQGEHRTTDTTMLETGQSKWAHRCAGAQTLIYEVPAAYVGSILPTSHAITTRDALDRRRSHPNPLKVT